MATTKYILTEKEMPTSWYNILPDLPKPLPPELHPGTKEPTILPPPLFPAAVNDQEYSQERYIEIPDEVQEIYHTWRPTNLHRAYRLEKALDTPAKIFYKYEGSSPAGSHKLNTAVAQAYYNKKEGITRLSTETGAGQWGSALALGCQFFGLELKVYMVKVSYHQKPYRRVLMESWGAQVVPSPSKDTEIGRRILAENPDSTGSLGIAISEAIEDAFGRDDTHYSIGSVANHVLLHQTVIGLESIKQMEMADAYPDIIVGCVGGGSNFAGLFLPWMKDKLSGKKPDLRFIAVEPQACPTLTRGKY
ncbi:MAG: TrpB-like pyridoxal phosphate-dependent enzyme, partial [Dehalococcoidales bacterium]